MVAIRLLAGHLFPTFHWFQIMTVILTYLLLMLKFALAFGTVTSTGGDVCHCWNQTLTANITHGVWHLSATHCLTRICCILSDTYLLHTVWHLSAAYCYILSDTYLLLMLKFALAFGTVTSMKEMCVTQIRMAWLSWLTNKATCWPIEMWTLCHFGN